MTGKLVTIDKNVCVDKAVSDALRWREKTGEDVLIAISKIKKTDKEDIDHAQAVTVRNSEFVPLTTHDSDGIVREWAWHYPDKKPYRMITPEQFIEEQNKVRNEINRGRLVSQ